MIVTWNVLYLDYCSVRCEFVLKLLLLLFFFCPQCRTRRRCTSARSRGSRWRLWWRGGRSATRRTSLPSAWLCGRWCLWRCLIWRCWGTTMMRRRMKVRQRCEVSLQHFEGLLHKKPASGVNKKKPVCFRGLNGGRLWRGRLLREAGDEAGAGRWGSGQLLPEGGGAFLSVHRRRPQEETLGRPGRPGPGEQRPAEQDAEWGHRYRLMCSVTFEKLIKNNWVQSGL